jgi:hypothetical protein
MQAVSYGWDAEAQNLVSCLGITGLRVCRLIRRNVSLKQDSLFIASASCS